MNANETKKLEQLRAIANGIKFVDPQLPGYKNLCAYLDKQSQDMLFIIACADIKFISSLAFNRLIDDDHANLVLSMRKAA